MTPIEHFLAWYDELGTYVKEDIAFKLGYLMPANSLRNEDSDDTPEALRSRVVTLAAKSTHADAALTVVIAAMVDFIMIGSSTAEDWVKNKAFNESVLSETRAAGQDRRAGQIERMLERLPTLSEQWLGAAKAWATLRVNDLSPTAVHIWLDRNPEPVWSRDTLPRVWIG